MTPWWGALKAKTCCQLFNTGWTQKHSLISSSYKIKTYWNIRTKLVATVAKSHTVSCGITHTQCAPVLLLGKHRCDNLAWTRLSAAYLAWPSWQLQWCVPAAHPRLRVVEVHRLCPSSTPKGKSHKRSGPVTLGATCRTPGHFVQRGKSICLASARWETCRQRDASKWTCQ